MYSSLLDLPDLGLHPAQQQNSPAPTLVLMFNPRATPTARDCTSKVDMMITSRIPTILSTSNINHTSIRTILV